MPAENLKTIAECFLLTNLIWCAVVIFCSFKKYESKNVFYESGGKKTMYIIGPFKCKAKDFKTCLTEAIEKLEQKEKEEEEKKGNEDKGSDRIGQA